MDQTRGRRTGTVALFAAVFIPLLLVHLSQLANRSQYQFFPVVLLAVAYFLYSRLKNAFGAAKTTELTRSYTFIAALLISACASLFLSPWLAMAAAIVLLYSVLVALYGGSARREFLWPCLLLLFLLPFPFDLDLKYVQFLQKTTIQLSSPALDYFNVSHLISGNVIQLPTRELMI